MHLAALELAHLFERLFGDVVRRRRDGQRDQHFVCVQTGVAAAQKPRFEFLYRFDRDRRKQIDVVVDVREFFERVEQHRRRASEQRRRLAGDDLAVRQFDRRGWGAGALFAVERGFDDVAIVCRQSQFVHNQSDLADLDVVVVAAALGDDRLVVAADDLLFARLAAHLVVADRVARHIDAHVRRRLVGGVPHQFFEQCVEHGEDLDVAVVVDRDLAVCAQMVGVDHIDVVEVGGRRLVGDVDGMVERQVPDRECLVLCISRLDAALVVVVELRQACRHLAAAGTGGGDDDKLLCRLDIFVLAVAFVADDVGDVVGIAFDVVVAVDFEPQFFEPVFESDSFDILFVELRKHDAADIKPLVAEDVDQSEHVLVVGDPEVGAQLVGGDVVAVDDDDDLRLVFELLQHDDLVVGRKAGQHARGVKVVEQLAAEFEVEFAAEFFDALVDAFRLHCQILFAVKTYFVHKTSTFPPSRRDDDHHENIIVI